MNNVPISDLFNIKYGHSLDLTVLQVCDEEYKDKVNYVSRTRENNGVSAVVKMVYDIIPFKAGLITVAGSGNSVMESCVQLAPFYTGFHVFVLVPREPMDDLEKLFYCHCIRQNRYKYNYGRQANKTLKNILVPSEMPKVFQNIILDNITYLPKDRIINNRLELNISEWKYFMYRDLFIIERGRGPRRKDIVKGIGTTPFITSIDNNNGLTGYVPMPPCHDGNTITVNRNGSVGEAFYQPHPFCSTEDVHVFKPRFPLNPFHAIFLITLIRKEQYRYCYGRKWGLERMKRTLIRLPVDGQGKPDWRFMEQYIKTLPFSSQIL